MTVASYRSSVLGTVSCWSRAGHQLKGSDSEMNIKITDKCRRCCIPAVKYNYVSNTILLSIFITIALHMTSAHTTDINHSPHIVTEQFLAVMTGLLQSFHKRQLACGCLSKFSLHLSWLILVLDPVRQYFSTFSVKQNPLQQC